MSERNAINGSQGGGEYPAIPGYHIDSELGRGGMGVVYRARHAASGRIVALKMIRDSALAGPQERGRFRIEAEAAARMRHPNIVQIHEYGEQHGRPYFAMELVEGPSLAAWLAERGTPARREDAEAAELMAHIADAVQHAHERGVVHRDLTPANILLRFAGAAGEAQSHPGALRAAEPLVTDFSLAKRLDTESTAWTQAGAVVGTLTYMAPEQAAGRVREVGPAVDVYALGAILYELLTGRPPFRAETWNDTVQQVLHEEPASPRRLRGDVPGELETICLKCLEKQPERRYGSAAEVADDLRRFLAGRPVAAVPPDARERLERLAGRDGYQILGEIGRGPRSTVYHAHCESIGQPVALKVFRAGACTRDGWEARRARAAETAAALSHPQIIAMHRTGWWDDSPYVAMDFAPLGSLATALNGQPMRVEHAAQLVEQLADIIAYCHRQGIVHGNLKPRNVFIAANEIPRIADFSITGGLFLANQTATDETPAEIAYLPPERLSDPAGEPRPNADIYGLGLILYELLTGRRAVQAKSAEEAREQVLAREIAPPSTINAQVPARIDTICMHCLSKDAWRRYKRAYEVAKQLRMFREFPDVAPISGRGFPRRDNRRASQ